MMTLFLGQRSYGVRERECTAKVGKVEDPLETLNAVSFHKRPIGDLRVQRSTLLRRDLRGSPLAGLTFQVFQFAHIKPIQALVEAP